MKLGPRAVRGAFFGYWNLMRRYHRFEVRHLERLDAVRPALIVGYHGRASAHDLLMLLALQASRGRMPRPIFHVTTARLPIVRWLVEDGGFLVGDEVEIARAVAAGDQILVAPGGTREACRPHSTRYQVDWGDRTGYLRLAVRHRLPIIPTAASGVDDTYIGLNDGYRWGKKLRVPGQLPAWLALGPLGPWPLSPPFPVKIVQHVGEPIDPTEDGPRDEGDREGMLRLHRRVTAAVQGLLDEANAR